MICLLTQALGGGGAFFHQRRILLRHLVEVADRLVDLRHPRTLFGRCCGDLANHVGHALHRLHDVGHGGARVRHQARARLHLLDRCTDEQLDLLGGLGAALGKAAHLAGHHRKTPALLTRAGSFHSGVQREDVGLKRYAINHANDVRDLLAAVVDVLHRGHHLVHHLAAPARHARGARRQAAGLLRTACALLDGAGELLHGGRRLLQVAGGLLGAGRQVVVARSNLGAGDGDAVGALAHLVHHAAQGAAHGIQRTQQVAKLVAPGHGFLHAQVAPRNAFGQPVGLLQGPLDAADQVVGTHNDGQQQQAHGHGSNLDRQHALCRHLLLNGLGALLLLLNELTQRGGVGRHRRVVLLGDQRHSLFLLPIALEFAGLAAQVDHGLARSGDLGHLLLVGL